MTMLKLKNLWVVFLFACILFVPAGAFAAQGDIFSIISAKMISTIRDVRKIVYVIAGFGLIMFAVLAVFNKISFKHLAYIMIGLSLLSVMMPFINYFSGAQLTDKDFNYGNFIAGGDASIVGSDASVKTDCSGIACPSEENQRRAMEMLPDSESLGVPGALNGGLKAPETGLALPGLGMGQDEKEKKSAKEVLQDVIKGGKAAIETAKNVATAVEAGVATYNSIKEGVENVAEVMQGDGNLLDKLGGLADVVSASAQDIKASSNTLMGAVAEGGRNVGAVGDVINGNNEFSSKVEESKFNQDLGKAQNAMNEGFDNVADYTGMAKDAYTGGKEIEALGNRVEGWFNNN